MKEVLLAGGTSFIVVLSIFLLFQILYQSDHHRPIGMDELAA